MNLGFLDDISESNRHNIVVIHCKPNSLNDAILSLQKEGLNVIDIGLSLSQKLKEVKSTKYLTIESQEFLQDLLYTQSRALDEARPDSVAIHNLGILFEPSLGLDPGAILKELSKTIALIILWEHQISPPVILHWGSSQDKHRLDFSDTTLTKVYPYEV